MFATCGRIPWKAPTSSYRLGRALLVTSTFKFCRGRGATRAGQGSGFCTTITPHTSPVASSPSHRTLRISLRVTLAVPSSENGPQGGSFRNHGGRQIECGSQTPGDSRRSLPMELPTMAGSMEQVRAYECVRLITERCHHYNCCNDAKQAGTVTAAQSSGQHE
jgi:hypothetical protein